MLGPDGHCETSYLHKYETTSEKHNEMATNSPIKRQAPTTKTCLRGKYFPLLFP